MMTNLLNGAHVANKLFSTIARLRLLLVMFVALSVSANAWGETVTFTSSNCTNWTASQVEQSQTIDGITLHSTKAANTSNQLRLYADNTHIITSTVGNITSVVFTCTANGTANYGPGKMSGDGYVASSGKTGEWTGNSTKVTLTGGQSRCTSIVVTYTPSSGGGGSTPTQLAAPTGLTVDNITSSGATLSWNTVANASSYTLHVYGENDDDVTEYTGLTQTTKEVSGLEPKTYYLWGVTAIGNGTTYMDSNEGTAEFTTSASAGGGGDGECTWQLVTDASTLKVGDEIVIAASNASYALSTTQNSNNRSATAITQNNNNNTITIDDNVQIITLCDGLQDNTLGFSVGSAGFLYAASSSGNQLKSKSIRDNNCDWVISITNGGIATIKAQGTYTRNIMRYNPNNGSPIFACYASSSTTGSLPAIYKKVCTAEPTQLATPTNLNATSITATSATLNWTWNESTNQAYLNYYNVYIYNENGTLLEGPITATNNSLSISKITGFTLVPATTYKFKVAAITNNSSQCSNSDLSDFGTFATNQPYTITYETNGGTTIENTSGTALPNPLPETRRDHYTFAGWYTDESCTQVAVAGATITSNTTLYAKWTPITYTVTFDAGSGTCATEPTQGNFENGLTLPTAAPCSYASTNGWSFVGWSESSVSETTVRPAIHTDNYKPTKTITLHAVYAKTGTAQGAAGEFILSLQHESTTYYVGQTFESSKLSAETNQANAARFTIEDNYLHYEGGYISHVAEGSANMTKKADKAEAQAWTIAENGNTITFTSTAEDTRGLGFNYNNGSPRFAAYKLNEKDGETIKYPSTFTKTSVSGGNVQVTTYNSNPSCEAPVNPTWQPATINFDGIIQVECGSKTLLNAADPNGPATITFNGYDLQNSVTVTASNGFLVSTDKVNDAGYKSEVTINPHKEGQNIGKLQNVYVIAQAPAQSGGFEGTITLTGNDIPGGSQVINVTADVTCTTYTITWSVDGDTELIAPTTFYAGGDWILPENPTYECNDREFVGWTASEILQPQDIVPNTLYKVKADFPTIESDKTFYAVFAKESNSGTTIITDVLTRATTGISNGSGYGTWSNKTATSSAIYAGQSAGGNDAIQLRSSTANNIYSGIVTTSSGGKAKKITVVWQTNTTNNRVLNIYGKNSAYSSAADLYDNAKQGTLLGSIKYGTSTELTIDGDYEYIGIRSNDAALYLTSISIDWETDDAGGGGSATYSSYTTSCADIKGIRIEGPTTTTFNEGDTFIFDGKVYAINNDDSETDVTASPNLRFVYDMHKTGTQTVKVNYLGKSATYEITINAVDKWKITWNVSGATNTGLGPIQVAKGIAIGALPQPKPIPAGCNGKAFVGWTESNEVNYDGSGITFITSETVPSANTTYYAVFATPSGDTGDGDYVKVTEDLADFSGEYLIVYEEGTVAFNGGLSTLDAVSNTISVTINNSTIESNATTDAAKFTIAQRNEGGYSIKSASGSYIGRTADANELDESTSTVYTNTISITDGNADIIASGGAHLRYNKTSGQTRFRYYKSSTYTEQQAIALYKKTNSSATYTDYTTGCHDCTITYYGFKGGYSTQCSGSDLNVFTQRVNSSHTIPNCGEITDPTTLGRTFLNSWKDQNGKTYAPGETFILTQDITLYAQWKLETTGDIELPADKEDLATTDIIVTGGTTLTLQAGTTTINSLTLKGGLLVEDDIVSGYAMPSVVIPDNATLVRKNTTINLDLVVNNDSWYPFAVPFALDKNDNIDYLDPVLKAASTYNTHFAIKTYDGENRAKVGTDQENNWDKVLQTAGLQPGKGYIISAMTYPDKDTATIRIPMSVSNDWLADGEQTTVNDVTRNAISVTAHTGAAAEKDICNAGWNFVANPYLTHFAGANMKDNDDLNLHYINGQIIVKNGHFEHDGTETPYVTVPAADFGWYEQYRVSDVKLSPMYSFFVQIAEGGTMNFTTEGRQQAPAALRASAAAANPHIEANLAIFRDEKKADHTGLIIDDRYTSNYEIGADLEKMFGSAYNTTIYTISQSTRLAYNALPHNIAQQSIPLGFRAAEEGEYTISLTNYEDIVGVESIILHDLYTGLKTNLLHLDYTFDSEATQDDNRFVVYIVARDNTTTDISTIVEDTLDKQNRKVLINNHLYIIHEGKMYNGVGQIVK